MLKTLETSDRPQAPSLQKKNRNYQRTEKETHRIFSWATYYSRRNYRNRKTKLQQRFKVKMNKECNRKGGRFGNHLRSNNRQSLLNNFLLVIRDIGLRHASAHPQEGRQVLDLLAEIELEEVGGGDEGQQGLLKPAHDRNGPEIMVSSSLNRKAKIYPESRTKNDGFVLRLWLNNNRMENVAQWRECLPFSWRGEARHCDAPP